MRDLSPPRPRLAVVATHPIQYYAPLFRTLTDRAHLDVRVFYEWEGGTKAAVLDRDFGQDVRWDIPLLDGYAHEFVPNQSPDPGTHHFRGLDNPTLVRRILDYRPNAVLLYGWSFLSHARVLRALHGRIPILFRGDSTLLDETRGPRQLARRLWLQWVYRHIDTALYVGQRNRAYFRAHGVADDRLVWAPHSVDHTQFADPDGAHEAAARQWRSELGIPGEAPTFVFAGKLDLKKAPDILVEAFLGISATDAHLVLVGSGVLEASLREAVARAGQESRVHFIGFVNQSRMPVAYRLGDALVLPSRGPGETWGLAVNEAMACGRAAVVSDRVGCAVDLVAADVTGHVVPAGDVQALRTVLSRLARSRPDRSRMGAAARRLISDWSMESQAAAVELCVARTGPATRALRHSSASA